VAEVPGEELGLADAVAVGWPVAGTVAEDVAEGAGDEVGLQAASANAAPAARTARPAGVSFPMTVTGTFLLVLMPDLATSLVSTSG
jgi:hypothetical protein